MDLGQYDENDLRTRLIAISQAVDKAELRNSEITSMEAFIYADMYLYDMAVSKFELVMAMEKANFSVKALEKYCNVRAKRCVSEFLKNKKPAKFLKEMEGVIKSLKMLLEIHSTTERNNLLGSAYKRKALIHSNAADKAKALTSSAYYYMKAHNSPTNNNKAYTLSNWFEIESILIFLGEHKWGDTIAYEKDSYKLMTFPGALSELETLKNSLDKASEGDMDYWNLVMAVNIELCKLVVDQSSTTDPKAWEDLLLSYRKIWAIAGSKGYKLSEIEHMELLIDGLLQIRKRDAVTLRKRVEVLKDELMKMI
jgi:hypothetical protein